MGRFTSRRAWSIIVINSDFACSGVPHCHIDSFWGEARKCLKNSFSKKTSHTVTVLLCSCQCLQKAFVFSSMFTKGIRVLVDFKPCQLLQGSCGSHWAPRGSVGGMMVTTHG